MHSLLGGVSGGAELSLLCLRFHARVQQLVSFGKLSPPAAYQITFRNILQTVNTFKHMLDTEKNCGPVKALTWSIIRNYTSCISSLDQRILLFQILAEEFLQSGILSCTAMLIADL